MKKIAIYIHIPFCDHKCIYCDFYSVIKTDSMLEFISSLKKEISSHNSLMNKMEITSIFFGGGTPSLLSPKLIGEILNLFQKKYMLSSNCEITLETNPGTVDLQKLKDFKKMGINRLSIGVQSFNNDELKFLTRIHDKKLAIKTVEDGGEAGFENINLDLIFALPKQTTEIWESNLAIAAELPITHISAYSLILERGTILNKLVLDGKVKMKDSDFDASLYEFTIHYLSEKNFIQYEVSNFSKEGYESIHNLSYWEHKNYLGFGPSAHSFVDGKRWWNFSGVKQYVDKVQKRGDAICGDEHLSNEELQTEYIMLALRSKGLDLLNLNKKYGSEWLLKNEDFINELINNNYLFKRDNFIKFTDKGYSLCDEILLKLN
ncbi:MAG: radical SAM family heme chaperone HemW [Melioribacteraceae bacterium]|nr:radical SAM family heme chaperone HemW [Melioribacteraceae bacterium]